MFLHARRLRFEHPASGEVIELDAPLPAAFEALVAALDAATPPEAAALDAATPSDAAGPARPTRAGAVARR